MNFTRRKFFRSLAIAPVVAVAAVIAAKLPKPEPMPVWRKVHSGLDTISTEEIMSVLHDTNELFSDMIWMDVT